MPSVHLDMMCCVFRKY